MTVRGSVGILASLCLAVVLPGCGGGGGGNSPAAPVVTQPPAPVRSLLGQGGFQLVSVSDARRQGLTVDAVGLPFTLGSTGTVDVVVDWTFASNDIDITIGRGNCSNAGIVAGQCTTVVESTAVGRKPETLTARDLAAGSYGLVILNFGPGAESGSYQVFVTR